MLAKDRGAGDCYSRRWHNGGGVVIPILPDSAWREFRGAPKQRGQHHTTHEALIADANGQEHKCHVKAAPLGSPMPLAEALAWLVSEALDLPRPKFAALLHLPVQRLRVCMPLDQHWMPYQHVLAFCASTVEGKHITGRWRWQAHLRAARAFRHEDVARIAAFDLWTENRDRHCGNFLRTRGGAYVPIDNEFILFTILWVTAGITAIHRSLQTEARTALKADGYKRFEGHMVMASKHHAAAFGRVAPTLRNQILALVADPAQGTFLQAAILQFLGQRAHPDWLAGELSVIP